MMFIRLIDPKTGEEVLTTESGVDALRAKGYTDPKKPKSAKKDKADIDTTGEQE